MSAFEARQWADVADPVLLAGERRRMTSAVNSRALSRLREAHRAEFDAIHAEELARSEAKWLASLRRRRERAGRGAA